MPVPALVRVPEPVISWLIVVIKLCVLIVPPPDSSVIGRVVERSNCASNRSVPP